MQQEKEECEHITGILKQVSVALKQKNALVLKEISNRTIHSASCEQGTGNITIAVIVYTLSKIIERKDYKKINGWDLLVKKFNSFLDLAIKALNENNQIAYDAHIGKARKVLESHSIALKPYIQDVLKKASINKGSKIYEHGISLEQTAKLLGVTQWELSDYIGQRTSDSKQTQTFDVKKRARMAMEFFS